MNKNFVVWDRKSDGQLFENWTLLAYLVMNIIYGAVEDGNHIHQLVKFSRKIEIQFWVDHLWKC